MPFDNSPAPDTQPSLPNLDRDSRLVASGYRRDTASELLAGKGFVFRAWPFRRDFFQKSLVLIFGKPVHQGLVGLDMDVRFPLAGDNLVGKGSWPRQVPLNGNIVDLSLLTGDRFCPASRISRYHLPRL